MNNVEVCWGHTKIARFQLRRVSSNLLGRGRGPSLRRGGVLRCWRAGACEVSCWQVWPSTQKLRAELCFNEKYAVSRLPVKKIDQPITSLYPKVWRIHDVNNRLFIRIAASIMQKFVNEGAICDWQARRQ